MQPIGTRTEQDAASQVALDALPLLDMRVGLYGSPRHAEVGGGVCFGMVITMGIIVTRKG